MLQFLQYIIQSYIDLIFLLEIHFIVDRGFKVTYLIVFTEIYCSCDNVGGCIGYSPTTGSSVFATSGR